MVAKIDTDVLKIFRKNQTQMWLKIGKKLKTASRNLCFTGFKQEQWTSTCSLLKNFKTTVLLLVKLKYTHQTTSRAHHLMRL